jgi:hypothetical protein
VSIAVRLLLLGECLQIASRPRSQADVPNPLAPSKKSQAVALAVPSLPETADEEMKFHFIIQNFLSARGDRHCRANLLLMEFDFDPCSGALFGLIPEAAAFANQAIESLIYLAGRRLIVGGSKCASRNVSVQDQRRNVDFFQVLGHVGLGERFNGKVCGGETGAHILIPAGIEW